MALAVTLATAAGMAQVVRGPQVPGPSPTPAAASLGDLRGRFGVAAAERAAKSTRADERLRGIERLAADPSAQSIDALRAALDPTGPASRDWRARLAAVRGLAPSAGVEEVRELIVEAMNEGVPTQGDLAAMTGATAALALARSGDATAFEVLARQAREDGPGGDAAAAAIVAYPPSDPRVLTDAFATPALAALLGAAGDLRAVPYLRKVVRQGEPRARADALVALARLGDAEAAPIARGWSTVDDPLARGAAVRTLLVRAPAEGRALVAKLLSADATRDEALGYAAEAAGPELAAALATAAAREPDAEGLARLVRLIGACGGPAASRALVALGARPGLGAEATLALAMMPGRDARDAIGSLFNDRVRGADALRAGVLRAITIGDAPPGLGDAVDAAWRDGEAAARRAGRGAIAVGVDARQAAAAFALVALGRRDADDAALHTRPSLTAAAARGALAAGPAQTSRLSSALAAADPSRRDALGVALLFDPFARAVPTIALRAWAEDRGAIAPLALRALAARDEPSERAHLATVYAAAGPVLRAHIADGLGYAASPDALGRLVEAYSFEIDAGVRRAVVRALARRPEPLKRRPLALAASLDPDAEARALAGAALRGATSLSPQRGALGAWVVVRAPAETPLTHLRWERPDGLVAPVVADPDGVAVIAGLPRGSSHVTLAVAPPGEQRALP